jgi:hypothetical protein
MSNGNDCGNDCDDVCGNVCGNDDNESTAVHTDSDADD